jgi:phage shock protein PspC (stress-responsive transcriptional regulator)
MDRPYRRLYRSRTEAQIGGVCAGLGEYLRVDPVAIRLLWVAAAFMTALLPGILAYLAAWLIVPPEPLPVAPPQPAANQTHEGQA